MNHISSTPPAPLPPPGGGRSCAWIQARAGAFVRWELPADEFGAVEEHLHDCPACAAVVREAERADDAATPSAPDTLSPEAFVAQTMARIRAWETQQTWQRRRRALLAAAASLALLLAAWAALRPHQATQVATLPPAPSPSVPAPEAPRTTAAACGQRTVPTWTEREFADLAWLRQLLAERFALRTPWPQFLARSGELLRIGWPASPDAPVRQPSLAALRHAAARVGFDLRPDPDGDILLPDIPWRDAHIIQGHRISLVRRPDTSPPPAARPPSLAPAGYIALLARQPELAHRILDHLAMAIPLADDPALAPFAIQCAHLREQLLDLPATPLDSCSAGDGCPRRLALANRIVRLAEELGERARISQPLDNQRPPQ